MASHSRIYGCSGLRLGRLEKRLARKPCLMNDCESCSNFHTSPFHARAAPIRRCAPLAISPILSSMAPEPDFSGCWAKLDHGRRHVTDLDGAVRSFFDDADNCPPLVSSYDEESRFHVFRVGPIPPQLADLQVDAALRAGDAVHDLRSALDHLVWQLSLAGTGGAEPSRPRRVQFPISTSPEGYEHARATALSDVSREAQDVLESYQPYHGAAGRPDNYSGPYVHQLTLLQQLSNADKHRLLTTVLSLSSGAHFFIPSDFLEPVEVSYFGFTLTTTLAPVKTENEYRLEEGAAFARAKLRGPRLPDGTPVGRSMPSLSLEENRPISPTLSRIADYVELILRSFAS